MEKQIKIITDAILEMEKQKMSGAEWQLVNKLRYYVNKYNTQIKQIAVKLD